MESSKTRWASKLFLNQLLEKHFTKLMAPFSTTRKMSQMESHTSTQRLSVMKRCSCWEYRQTKTTQLWTGITSSCNQAQTTSLQTPCCTSKKPTTLSRAAQGKTNLFTWLVGIKEWELSLSSALQLVSWLSQLNSNLWRASIPSIRTVRVMSSCFVVNNSLVGISKIVFLSQETFLSKPPLPLWAAIFKILGLSQLLAKILKKTVKGQARRTKIKIAAWQSLMRAIKKR